METQKLRLGLLLSSSQVPAWFFHAVKRIVDSGSAEFIVIALNNGEGNDADSVWLNKPQRKPRNFVYQVLNQIDTNAFVRKANAFTAMDLRQLLPNIPLVTLKVVREGCGYAFNPEDVKTLREHGLDIIIQMGFGRLKGEILLAAKYGVWYYEHSDTRRVRGGPAGFWEVAESCPQTGAALQLVGERSPNGRTIYRSSFLTYPFSPARNRNKCFWAASSFLSRQINLLYSFGEERFYQETEKYNQAYDLYDRKNYQTPTNLEAVGYYAGLLARNLGELYQRFMRLDTWYLMFDLSAGQSPAFNAFKKIMPPKDRLWADPHVIRKEDRYFIFIEELIFKNRKGHIAVMEMDLQGNYTDPVLVLETDHHLSYPFVFSQDEKYYMIPESGHNRTIDLYECVEFPFRWKFKMSLIENVRAVDTTLFFHNGKWWLFTGLAEIEGAYPEVELFLFYADVLHTTQWQSHPLNPIVSDVSSARPAGKLFIQDGRIYRPSQDCSKNYGYGFNINEILRLSETEYFEKKAAAVKPDWDKQLIAAHTYTSEEGLVIIDGLTRRSKYL